MNKKYLTFLFLVVMGITLFAPCYNTTNAAYSIYEQNLPEEGPSDWASKYLDPVIKGFFNAIMAGMFAIPMAIAGAFFGMSQSLLDIVVSPTFINVSFIDNPFVEEGLKITKDLTNILIVLGLVVIALATILRISSYEMKKTLPLFLLVAILINFTPVFCGVAIDASTIVMNHFLEGGGLLTVGLVSLLSTDDSASWTKEDPALVAGRGTAILGFYIFAGLILLLFAMLFLFRYVALWMLIILSPLALFCIIFPRTKTMWDKWLSQFIQWCFIGIPIAFTIHIANIITVELVEKGSMEGISGATQIFGYLLPLTFLIAGFFMSLQIGAMGASIVTSRMKKAYTATKQVATNTAVKRAKGTLKSISSMGHSLRRIKHSYQAARYVGAGVFGAGVYATSKVIARAGKSVFNGSVEAVRDMSKEGASAFVGGKKSKKGTKICPHCKQVMSKSAPTCTNCGYDFT